MFFFETDGRQREATERAISRLNRLTARPDWLVIGLSPDRRAKVAPFIERQRIRFCVGAGSRSAKRLGVESLPGLLVIDRKGEQPRRAVPLDEVDALTPEWTREQIQALDSPDELRAFIESDYDGMTRAARVHKLHAALDSDSFLEFVEERLPVENDAWVRGSLRFHRDAARGAPRNDERLSRSATALNSFEENQADPRWAKVRLYGASDADRADFAKLHEAYKTNASDDPADALVRRFATEDLWHRCTDRAAARELLLQIVQIDPDYSVRMIAAMALGEVCPVGDVATANLLEDLARQEPNVLRVRPMMEYVSQYLRTGEEDAARMPPMP